MQQSKAHDATDKKLIRCRILVISDTRTLETDTGGKAIAESLVAAGHLVVKRVVVPDDRQAIVWHVETAVEDFETDAVIITGGTGFGLRDVTPEAVEPMLTRLLPGFGEAFRRLSYDEVGTHGLLSRAFAGAVGHCMIFALPGSEKACMTAMNSLIVPMLPHVVGLMRH